MFFGWFYYDWTILIVLPAMLFAMIAQLKVNSTFERYSKVNTRSGMTAAQAARNMLDANGLYDVMIARTKGHLSDHYNPKDRTLYLSDSVHDSRSSAAIGVACHEAGHALQHAKKYAPLHIRMSMVPVCNIGSGLAMPLFLIGLLFAGDFGYVFMLIGIALFSLATLFQLVTLPVEFDASKRALAGMESYGILAQDEIGGAKKVLSAAAMTYVAALATSLLSLLRLILIANSRRD
ncbi:MAG: zinc metallopeptidase [Clostridia bacterium]|nr:zinc metallopeptidase [Clostridia bacterium]